MIGLYSLVYVPTLLLLSMVLIAFAIYRLLKSKLNTTIEIFILVSFAIILLAMSFSLGFANLLLAKAFWPIIILFSILMLISSRNNNY